MNLIPNDEVPSLPNDVIIGWSEIQKHDLSELRFVDHNFLEKNPGNNRRNEHISSRKLFQDLLSKLDISLEAVKLEKMELGKPVGLLDESTLHISFSHSASWVVCAISQSIDIGIDCEPLDRKVNPKIFDRILDEEEKKLLEELSPLAIWTIKEAVVKCIGTGIRTSLQKYAIKKEGDKFFVDWENDRISIVPFVWENHQLAVAWRE